MASLIRIQRGEEGKDEERDVPVDQPEDHNDMIAGKPAGRHVVEWRTSWRRSSASG